MVPPHSVPPSYHSSPVPTDGLRPSDLYGRSAPPSDVASQNFHWSDDAASTIAPDDSVSQLDRRFTGRRRVLGPRPMDHAALGGGAAAAPPVPEVPEEYQLDESVHRDYVPPELLEDDRSTVVPAPQQQQQQQQQSSAVGMRAINPSTAPSGPLARARGEATAIPYASAAAAAQDQYHGDDDADEASRPLVPGGGSHIPPSSHGSATNVTPYSRPTQQSKGYAAVGHDDDEDDDGGVYAAYSRRRDADLEAKAGSASAHTRAVSGDSFEGPVRAGAGAAAGGGLFGGLLNSIRGRRAEPERAVSFYAPNELAFRPPSRSSLDFYGSGAGGKASYPPGPQHPLDKIPSLDVVPAHDRGASFPGAAGGGRGGYGATGARGESIAPKPLWQRWFWDTTDAERRVWEHKQGVGMQRWPFASWGLAVAMTIVFIIELVRMNSISGSAIQTKPSFNPMIGTMSAICGFGGFQIVDGDNGPDQSFRFFTAIFLHVGVIHLLFNMLAQCLSAALVERMMGTPRFLVLYLASGIFGNILGGNFALVGLPSAGASGAIFGTQAAFLVDLLAHWKIEYRPKRKLLFLVIELIIGFGLGWIPGLDNFAHLGGFLVGLLSSIVLMPIVHPSRAHKLVFVTLRLIALPVLIVVFVVLTKNFYTGDPEKACSWCRYLSCWPTDANNRCHGTGLTQVTTSSSTISSLLTVLVSTLILPLL
ncbi:hypothetical protein Rhopal_000971-T1 [Rhodotorula paludigena]|uniref:Rhomboid-type serine protease n=1 Tax=Rhodotorula paludigena TaxID=86838 RepID=A0AAV5GE37_9BASI|nr:hypothetical protein Rhopal_000971-T1 [Rhodotorula paludigena]